MLGLGQKDGSYELALIVEAGTVATMLEMPSGQLADLATEYHDAGDQFMLGLVAKAAVAAEAQLGWANMSPLPRDGTRRKVFGQKIARIHAMEGYSEIYRYAVGEVDHPPYQF